jgi:CheY-like chemotaxis protein
MNRIKLQILMGDDNEDLRNLFQAFFKDHEITVVSKPTDLIERASSQRFDVIVSDFDYGLEMNGLEALGEIKGTALNFDTLKIIWSGSVMESDSKEDFENLQIHFVNKGRIKDVVSLVETTLSHRVHSNQS